MHNSLTLAFTFEGAVGSSVVRSNGASTGAMTVTLLGHSGGVAGLLYTSDAADEGLACGPGGAPLL